MADETIEKRVNGRRAILQALDAKLAEEGNIRQMADMFQAQIDDNPYGFFTDVVMKLLPREELGEQETKGQELHITIVPKEA